MKALHLILWLIKTGCTEWDGAVQMGIGTSTTTSTSVSTSRSSSSPRSSRSGSSSSPSCRPNVEKPGNPPLAFTLPLPLASPGPGLAPWADIPKPGVWGEGVAIMDERDALDEIRGGGWVLSGGLTEPSGTKLYFTTVASRASECDELFECTVLGFRQ